MSRRGLLATGAGLGAALGAALGLTGMAPPAPLRAGVQLWTVDSLLREAFEPTLEALAALGFREVETAGLHDRTPQAFATALADAGLRAAACHASMGSLVEHWDRELEAAQALGAGWLVCASPQPSRPVREGAGWSEGLAEAMTEEDWARHADDLNRMGAAAKASGVRVGYHNHDFELAGPPGRRPLDRLIAGTDEEVVDFELDVGWAAAAGVDPAALIRAHPSRIRLLHLKDMARTGAGWRSVAVGAGVVDWPALAAAALGTGVALGFVEQEPPFERSPLHELAESRRALLAL